MADGPRIGFLCADTIRSRAYAQAMVKHAQTLAGIALVTSSNARYGQSRSLPTHPGALADFFVPDLTIDLERSLTQLSAPITRLGGGSVNDRALIPWAQQHQLDYVVYSGFGGEIVAGEIIYQLPPLLHMHAGYLPDFRGSTTCYYSYLHEGMMGVSAIFLREQIDAGPLLVRRRFAPPPAHWDLDYYFDSTIRAAVLIEALGRIRSSWPLPLSTIPQPEAGTNYYVIHPVLKHLALLKLRKSALTCPP